MYLNFRILYGNRQSGLIPGFHPTSHDGRAVYKFPRSKRFQSPIPTVLSSLKERALSPPIPDPRAATSQDRSLISCCHWAFSCVVARLSSFSSSERNPTGLCAQSLSRPRTRIFTHCRLPPHSPLRPAESISLNVATVPTSILKNRFWALQ